MPPIEGLQKRRLDVNKATSRELIEGEALHNSGYATNYHVFCEDLTSYELNHNASGLLTSILVNMMMKILGPYKVGNSLNS